MDFRFVILDLKNNEEMIRLKSKINNPKFKKCNPKSAITNPKYKRECYERNRIKKENQGLCTSNN